jgi:hypothetical protein
MVVAGPPESRSYGMPIRSVKMECQEAGFSLRTTERAAHNLGLVWTRDYGPDRSWMAQMARNLTDAFDGFLRAPLRYVLMDRDAKFTAPLVGKTCFLRSSIWNDTSAWTGRSMARWQCRSLLAPCPGPGSVAGNHRRDPQYPGRDQTVRRSGA